MVVVVVDLSELRRRRLQLLYRHSSYIRQNRSHHRPTTNPLFVSQAGSNGDARYEAMVMEAVAYAKTKTCSQDGCDVPDETLNMAVDRLAVNLGKELVGLIDGRVITEVDIRLSYDTNASVE